MQPITYKLKNKNTVSFLTLGIVIIMLFAIQSLIIIKLHSRLYDKAEANNLVSEAIITYALIDANFEQAIEYKVLFPQNHIDPKTQSDQYNIIFKKVPNAIIVKSDIHRELTFDGLSLKVYESLVKNDKVFVSTYSHHFNQWVTIYYFFDRDPGFYTTLWVTLLLQLSIIIALTIIFYLGNKVVIKDLFGKITRIGTDSNSSKFPIPILANSALQQLHRKINYLSYEKTIILSSLSHEVKNNLAKLMLVCYEIKNEKIQQIIEDEIHDIELIIESSLSFANGKNKKYTREFNLKEMLNIINSYLISHGYIYTFENKLKDYKVIGYPALLRRAIVNIVSNSNKYANNTSINAYIYNQKEFIIEISDEGPGIPKKSIDQILNPYNQTNFYENHNVDSTAGIGLAIAKTAIEYNDGTISLQNTKTGLLVTMKFIAKEK